MLRDVLGAVPTREEAISYLSRRLDQFLAGSVPGPTDQNNQVTLWIWDVAQQTPRTETFDANDASFLAAALVADELYRLDPNDQQSQQLYLVTALEAAKRINGYGRPITKEMGAIFEDVRAAGTDLLQGALELAVDKELQGAAVAVIDTLAATGDQELVRSDDGKPRILVASLLSPLPRVKSAAARAIMSIDPTSAYAGSSYLPEVLGYLSASGGRRRVLIGHPRRETAQELAGYFNVMGFQVDTRQRGRDVVLQAATNPDYAFVLVHDSIDRPGYRELVQVLRRDPRTADLPVGLITRPENEQSAHWFANTDALTLDLAPPLTRNDLATDSRRLLGLAGRGLVTPDERMGDAIFALDALAKLAADEQQYGFYDLLPLDQRMEKALNTPELAARAAQVLGLLGTPPAQQALLDLANNHVRAIAERQAAAAAFRTAVSRRGLLLTRADLLRQYDIYNASEFLDQQTQAVLASILDTIEGPSQAAQSARNDD
jgi:hypothetical protein